MASVIFLRAVNVGGRICHPKALADELGLVNIGAAGTFIAPGAGKKAAAGLKKALPFESELFACPGSEITELVANEPFAEAPAGEDVKYDVTVFAEPLASELALPRVFPSEGPWQLQLLGLAHGGRYGLTCRRVLPGGKGLYPNAVLQREFGVVATTRGWPTFCKLAKLVAPR